MPWLFAERKSKTRSARWSKYKDIARSECFRLQARKPGARTGTNRRPNFRIITKSEYPIHEIAYGNFQDAMMTDHWSEVQRLEAEQLPRLKAEGRSEHQRRQWFWEYFKKLAEQKSDASIPESDEDLTEADMLAIGGRPETPRHRSVPVSKGFSQPRKAQPAPSQKSNPGAARMVAVVGVAVIAANAYGTQERWTRLIVGLAVLLFIISFYSIKAANLFFKLRLWLSGIAAFFLSKDKSFPKPTKEQDPLQIKDSADQRTKTIIFIRHGESEWNSIFNMGLHLLPGRLVTAALREVALLTTRDSIFFDSPLNQEGFAQAKEMAEFLRQDSPDEAIQEAIDVLRGDGASSMLVVSPLRRAIGTIHIGLEQWIRAIKEGYEAGDRDAPRQCKLLSTCQEISRNVDAISLADEPDTLPVLSRTEKLFKGRERDFNPEATYDTSGNTGNKRIRSKGAERLKNFVHWCFQQEEDVIVVGGHSLWFRYFFRTYLDHDSTHRAKTQKIANSGIIQFTLEQGTNKWGVMLHRVDPDSILPIYKDFGK